MSQSFLRGAAALAVLLVMSATVLFAQGVITDIKTQPMQNSETTIIPIAIHNTVSNPSGGIIGWVGALMKVHILDATEVDVDGFTSIYPSTVHYNGPLGPGSVGSTRVGPIGANVPWLNPFGPRSANVATSPITFTMITPNWQQSGQNVTASVNKFLGSITIHAKNTTPANNSDVDMTFMFWNIWHVRPGLTPSVSGTLKAGDRLLVNSASQTGPALDPLDPNNHWITITQTGLFHVGDPSVVFATFLNTATFGLEHMVPEPATWALMVLGLVALAVGVRMRRKRLFE